MDKEVGNKLDLILNVNIPFEDNFNIEHEYYQYGNVFLGGVDALTPQIIHAKEIRAILTVMDIKSYEKDKVKAKVNQLGLLQEHLLIDIKDSADLSIRPYFEQAINFIEKQTVQNKNNILVHCKGGRSRSATIVTAFTMQKYKTNFAKTYELLQKRRSIVNINEGFKKELKEYQVTLKK